MALTVPTDVALLAYWGDDAITQDPATLNQMLQLSADLLWLATDLENDPVDVRLFRLEQLAIIDMAIYMTVQASQATENYNNYSMEMIGSYRYMKKLNQQALNAETGVIIFDKFLNYWLWNGNSDGTINKNKTSFDTEDVFHFGAELITISEQLIHAAPAVFEFGRFNGIPSDVQFVDSPGNVPSQWVNPPGTPPGQQQ